MDGNPMRLEKVVSPQPVEQTPTLPSADTPSPQSKSGKVISLVDLKKK
jgi:hypothetical protein